MNEEELHRTTSVIQSLITEGDSGLGVSPEELESLLHAAKAGEPGSDVKTIDLVKRLLYRYNLEVPGLKPEEAARAIYKYLWGLDVVEDLYREPTVDEVRVNDPTHVYIQEKGRNRKTGVRFKDGEHIAKIISRLVEHDRVALDESNPGIESRRLDGARVTALTAPLTEGPCLVIRKHGTFAISDENYVSSGTMDGYTVALLKTLVKGRANILISGGTGSGKTTLLRWLAKYLDERLRVVTLETDRELLLEKWYPERDVVSLEAHPELQWDMKRCFTIILRLTPDVIIVGEARGLGEAGQMIEASRRGHHGSMGTIHTGSAREAVLALAQMALEEGRRLPIEILEEQAASAFDVVVQMYGNNLTGVKKIECVAEVWPGDGGPKFRDLVVWKPSAENYEEGVWAHPHFISNRLANKLFKYGVGRKEMETLKGMM